MVLKINGDDYNKCRLIMTFPYSTNSILKYSDVTILKLGTKGFSNGVRVII